MNQIPLIERTLALRTCFGDEAAWQTLCEAIQNPDEEFHASVEFVNDREYSGVTAQDLPELVSEEAELAFAFIIDRRALDDPEHPILVVDLLDEPGRSFRVIREELWAVENNLSLANMEFDDFASAVDAEGVFRGLH